MVVDSFRAWMEQAPVGTFVLAKNIAGIENVYIKVARDIFFREAVVSGDERLMRLCELSDLQRDVYEIDDTGSQPQVGTSQACNCDIRTLLMKGCTDHV